MKSNTAQILTAAALAMFLTVPATAQQPASEAELRTLAENADSASDHARVAKEYRLRAEKFEAEAIEHEQRVKNLTRSAGAMARKWPGMATNQLQKAKRQAVEARRAAQENMALADRHIRLSVEAQAVTAD